MHANAENVVSLSHTHLQKHNILLLVLQHSVTLFLRNNSKASSNKVSNHLHQHLDLARTCCMGNILQTHRIAHYPIEQSAGNLGPRLQVFGTKSFPNHGGRNFLSAGIAQLLNNLAEFDREIPGKLDPIATLHKKGNPSLSGLTVDANNRFVATSDVFQGQLEDMELPTARRRFGLIAPSESHPDANQRTQ